jgi:2-oxoglutarate dehydrogenase E1 component
MCAEDNMQIANCTTPANYFHILRRQLKRDIRKPLIMMTPKSLLRNKRATSRLEEFAEGTSFHRILWDDAEAHKDQPIKLVADDKIRRVVMCSGKVYFDLYEEREKRGSPMSISARRALIPAPQGIDQNSRVSRMPNLSGVRKSHEYGALTYAQHRARLSEGKNTTVGYAGRCIRFDGNRLMSRHLKELKELLKRPGLNELKEKQE